MEQGLVDNDKGNCIQSDSYDTTDRYTDYLYSSNRLPLAYKVRLSFYFVNFSEVKYLRAQFLDCFLKAGSSSFPNRSYASRSITLS